MTEVGLESCFRFQLSQDFQNFKTFELYKKLSSTQVDKLLCTADCQVENRIWKLSHYKIISEFRSRLKIAKGNEKTKLSSNLSYFLTLSQGTYLNLLTHLSKSYNLTSHLYTLLQTIPGTQKPPSDLIFKVYMRLGDLSRYKDDCCQAKMWYEFAIEINPNDGQVYNQFGVMCGGIEAVDYYLRGVRWGFEGAKGNLEKVEWFGGFIEIGGIPGEGVRVRGRICVAALEVYGECRGAKVELMKVCKEVLEGDLNLEDLYFVTLVVKNSYVDKEFDKGLARAGTSLLCSELTGVLNEKEYIGLPIYTANVGSSTLRDLILTNIRDLIPSKRMYEKDGVFSTEPIRITTEQGEFIEESDTLNTLSFLGLSPKPLQPEKVKRTSVRLVSFPSPIGSGTRNGFGSGNGFRKSQVVKDDQLFWKLSEYQQSMLSGGSSFGLGSSSNWE